MAATHNSNEEPNYESMMKLIKKAWEKPAKISKFYKSVQTRNAKPNLLCILKTCVVLQYYFLYGPAAVFHGAENLPLAVLEGLAKNWPSAYSACLKQLAEVLRSGIVD